MDNENEIPQQFEANLSSMQGDFVVLNYNGTDVDLGSQLSDVHLSDKHTTMLDEKNLIQSWEHLKEENTSLREQIQKVNQLLTKRIEEMKEMKSAQGKWMEMNESNHKRAKDEILSLREEKHKYKQCLESIMKELSRIIQKEMDPESKKCIEHILLQIKEVEEAESKEKEKTESNDGVEVESKEKAEQTMSDGHVSKLNLLIAEMTEQLKCKDEQIDLIAKQLSEMKKTKQSMDMGLVSEKSTEKDLSSTSTESNLEDLTSIRYELTKVTSINTQLNENLTSLQKLRIKNQSEIEALKADVVKYQQMQEEKSKEFNKLRTNITKLQTDKGSLEQSLASHQQRQCTEVTVKSPPSASQASVSSTEAVLGSATTTGEKSYKRESSDDGETVQNLMMIFRTERQKCGSLQEKLTKESKRVHDLEMELLITQQEVQTRSSKLGKEMSKREKEHDMTVEELNKKLDNLSKELLDAQEPRYQSTGENMRALRSQVMALMAELEEMNKQVADANIQVQKRNERIKSLELKNSVLASEQHNQTMQDTAIIERLQIEIRRLNGEAKGYIEVVEERNDLLMKLTQFQGLYQDVCHKFEEAKHKAVDEKEFDELTMKLISSEEVSGRKDYQIQQLQDNVKHFEDQCAALIAQAELYKMDFEAEREAREKSHSEKENLIEKIKQQEQEIEQLKDDQSPARKSALEDLQRRYNYEGSQAQPTQLPQHTVPSDVGSTYGRQGDYYPLPVGGPYYTGTAQPQPQLDYRCPVCQRQFPDIDTLQIHVMDCIN